MKVSGQDPAQHGKIAVLGDWNGMQATALMAHAYSQCHWIAAQASARNIGLVVHAGDIVNSGNSAAEFSSAANALDLLWGVVPRVVAAGNHDDASSLAQITTYLVRTPFDAAQVQARFPQFQAAWVRPGIYPTIEIEFSWHKVRIGSTWWGVIQTDYFPTDQSIYSALDLPAWITSVCAAHPTMPFLLVTHAYLYRDGTRYDWYIKGAAQEYTPHLADSGVYPIRMDGQQLWDAVVKINSNIRLVISGHDSGYAHRTDVNDAGYPVHQFVFAHMENTSAKTPYSGYLELELNTASDRIVGRVVSALGRGVVTDEFAIEDAGLLEGFDK